MPPESLKRKSQEKPAESNTTPVASATSSSGPKKRKMNADAEDSNEKGGEGGGHKSSSTHSTTKKRFVAGDRSRPITFEACHQNEAQLAAFVGYKDMASFRTFLLSPLFLKYYLLFDTDWSKGMRAVRAFEQTRDVWLAGNIRETFSTSWNDVDRYRPSTPRTEAYGKLSVEGKEQTDQYLAQILILMVEECAQASPIVVDKEEHEKSSKRLIQLKPKVGTVPDISGRQVQLPQMKVQPPAGRQAQESDLEAYNRALNLLRHMSHTTNNAWAGRYEKGFWDRSNTIDPALMPDFMHYQPVVVEPKYTVAEALKAGNMSEKKYILSWSTLEHDDEVKEYIKNNNELPFPPRTGIPGLGDPRVLDSAQYRDSLRLQCRCHENGLQLAAVSMDCPATKDNEEGEQFDLFSIDWDVLCEALQEYPDSDEIDVQIELQSTVRQAKP